MDDNEYKLYSTPTTHTTTNIVHCKSKYSGQQVRNKNESKPHQLTVCMYMFQGDTVRCMQFKHQEPSKSSQKAHVGMLQISLLLPILRQLLNFLQCPPHQIRWHPRPSQLLLFR